MTSRFPSTRNALWRKRVSALRRDGFTREEAVWAADHNLRLGDVVVKQVRQFRKLFVKDYLKVFRGTSRAQAIRAAATQLRSRNVRFGLTGADINNIFREISN